MGRLQYAVICSLDGYTADADGKFDWAMPDAELHAAVNDLERPTGTYLYGRSMYQTLAVWQTIGGPDHHPIENDYADIWRTTDKVVYSSTLEEVSPDASRTATKDKLREQLRAGRLDERLIELEVKAQTTPMIEIFSATGMGEMDQQLREMLSNVLPSRTKQRPVEE